MTVPSLDTALFAIPAVFVLGYPYNLWLPRISSSLKGSSLILHSRHPDNSIAAITPLIVDNSQLSEYAQGAQKGITQGKAMHQLYS